MRFCGTFNALYCRRTKFLIVCVELLKSFCLPMILYASEVTDPKKSVLAMLDNLIDRVVLKIFKVSEKLVIRAILDCMMLRLCVK